MTYNERVQDIAKSISEANNNGKWGPGLADWDKSMRAAHIAVAEKAEGIISFFNTFVLPALPKGDLSFSPDALADYLKEQGLIPDSPSKDIEYF